VGQLTSLVVSNGFVQIVVVITFVETQQPLITAGKSLSITVPEIMHRPVEDSPNQFWVPDIGGVGYLLITLYGCSARAIRQPAEVPLLTRGWAQVIGDEPANSSGHARPLRQPVEPPIES